MKPLSRFRKDQDEKFRRVRENLPGRGGVYEKTWRDLVPGNVKQYPSSAAFVDRIWDGRRAYLLCELCKERAQECDGWLAKLKSEGRVFYYEVYGGDWRDRFNRARKYPLARLKQDKATVQFVDPDAVFVSFDPNKVCCSRGTHRAALGGTLTARELLVGGSGFHVGLSFYYPLRCRASVAVFPLVLRARRVAWSERLRPCHWRLAMPGFPARY